MRSDLYDITTFASSALIIYGGGASGNVGQLMASDDVYMSIPSVLVGSEQRVEVEFMGTHSGHMPFLQALFELHTSIDGVNLVLQAWNYLTGAYETSGSMYLTSGSGTTDVNYYLYSLFNNTNYRDASGNWKVKVSAYTTGSPPPSFTLYLDYLHYRTVAYQLGTTQTGSATSNAVNVKGITVGIRVWKVKADDTEEEITLGSLVATVTGPGTTTTLNNTYTPPLTSDVVAIVVRVYRAGDIMNTADESSGGLPFVFMTEDLNSFLNAVQWTVYYAFVYFGAPIRETYFFFGTTTYNSRIANFTWGAVVVKKPIMKMDLGPHPRSRLLFAPTLFLGAKSSSSASSSSPPSDPWEGWFMDEV